MGYYVLNEGFELCGWKGLPFGLRYPNPHYTDFFDKETYKVVLSLDGRTDIDEDKLSERQKSLLKHLLDVKIALPSDGKKRLEPWQEYKSFPAMYKKHAHWSITGRCNYKCRHCFMSAPDYCGEDLTMDQIRHILDELVKCGIRTVALTGGEPLVHPCFYEMLDEIRNRGIHLDTIYSNGELIDERFIEELKKREMDPAIHISFDGVGWHDWIRGVDGAEESTIRAFKLLHEHGFQTSTSMCLHKHNIGTLKESIDLLGSIGVIHVKMNVATPTGRWKNETEHFISQDEANEAILEYIPQYVADGMPVSVQFCGILDFNIVKGKIDIPYRKYSGVDGCEKTYACGAVKTGMYISPVGKILPCMTIGGTAIDAEFDSVLEKPLGASPMLVLTRVSA